MLLIRGKAPRWDLVSGQWSVVSGHRISDGVTAALDTAAGPGVALGHLGTPRRRPREGGRMRTAGDTAHPSRSAVARTWRDPPAPVKQAPPPPTPQQPTLPD